MNWETLMNSRHPNFLIKGSELAQLICGPQMRFAIVETRAMEADGSPGVVYRVRDAATVTDAQVRGGKRPAIVATFKTFEDAQAYCNVPQ